jgi:predicted nucleotidyltransferase
MATIEPARVHGAEAPLACLVPAIVDALGDQVVGVYLFGSLASGDFDAGISDLDLLVAVTGAPDDAAVARLDAAHDRCLLAHPDFAGRLDILYAPAALLAGTVPLEQAPPLYSVSPGEGASLRRVVPTVEWSINWHLAREARATLWGAPVEVVVRGMPPGQVEAVNVAHVRRWQDGLSQMRTRKGKAYAVLTLCRLLFALETGRQPSKRAAAAWAAERWPDLGPTIQAALDWRRDAGDDETVPADFQARVQRLLDLAVNAAHARMGGGSNG